MSKVYVVHFGVPDGWNVAVFSDEEAAKFWGKRVFGDALFKVQEFILDGELGNTSFVEVDSL